MNMLPISMTFDTSQLDISLLNDIALMNIPFRSVTFDTSHLEISQLKDVARQNILAMLVTWDTSHSVIELRLPLKGYTWRHSSTALLSSALSAGEKAVPSRARHIIYAKQDVMNVSMSTLTFSTSHIQYVPTLWRESPPP